MGERDVIRLARGACLALAGWKAHEGQGALQARLEALLARERGRCEARRGRRLRGADEDEEGRLRDPTDDAGGWRELDGAHNRVYTGYTPARAVSRCAESVVEERGEAGEELAGLTIARSLDSG